MLSLVAVLSMSAATLDMSKIGQSIVDAGDKGYTVDGYTITVAKNDGKTNPAYNAGDAGIRLYAKNTITITSASSMKKMVFTLSKSASYRYTDFTPSAGYVATQAAGDKEINWTGDAASVTFTVGDKATMGSDGDSKDGQIRFTTITIDEDGPVVPPTPTESVDNIKAWLDAQSASALAIKNPVTAVYQNGNRLYIKDNTGWLLVYGTVGNTYTNGDIIPGGIAGTYDNFNDLPEMKPTADTFGAPTAGTAVAPTVVAVGDVNAEPISSYIELRNVTLTAIEGNDRSMTISDENGDEVVLYNSLYQTVTLPEAGSGYTVRGFVAINKGVYQVTPIEFVKAGQENKVSAPVFNPKGGDVLAGTKLYISTSTVGADIYYTIDGSTPTDASNVYAEPIEINKSMTVKAIAVKDGMTDSEVTTATFTVVQAPQGGSDNYFVAPGFTDEEFTGAVKLNNNGGNNEPANDDAKDETKGLTGLTFSTANVSITFNHGDGQYYTTSFNNAVRFYQGESMTITPAAGKRVVEIYVATAANSKGDFTVTVDGNTTGVVTGTGVGVENPITWVGEITNPATLTTNKQVRFKYINIKTADLSGIEGVEADLDENAPVEYYNLQGQRVNNPSAGLYIMKQGRKVSKVLVK